ncbi:hypothetical protein ACH3XW_3110 [Acanthocheilonema viteae]
MSNKVRETTILRPSLKKQPAQAQIRSKDLDAKRHVTFATPKLPPPKCNLLKEQPTSDQSISKFRKQKSVIDAHRKRIPSVQFIELRAKKNKHNEQIVRLCEAQEALVRSGYVIKRMEKEAKEQETAATELLRDAVSLIEIDVLRSFEKQRIGDFLDNVEQQQLEAAQKLHEELDGFDEKIASIGKALATIEKYNELLNAQLKSTEGEEELSVAEEMKLLSDDINVYLGVLDSLKQFHL